MVRMEVSVECIKEEQKLIEKHFKQWRIQARAQQATPSPKFWLDMCVLFLSRFVYQNASK